MMSKDTNHNHGLLKWQDRKRRKAERRYRIKTVEEKLFRVSL